MKKYGWKLILLIILAAFVFIWLIRAPLLSSYLSKKTGLNISLRWIGVWPSHTNIHYFAVKNPPGFDGNAFKANQIVCRYKLGELFGDPTVIDEIKIQNSVLRIDFTKALRTSNNWTVLGQMMPQQKSHSHVMIKKLVLTNFNVEIHGHNFLVQAKQTHFDRLEFDDIDSQEGFPTELLIRLIFESSGLKQYIQDFFNPAGNVQKVLNPLRLFGT